MNILVTGGLGFIGHHLVDYILEETDHHVTILDRIDVAACQHRITELDSYQKDISRVSFVWHDLRAEVNKTVANLLNKPDIILHLAAGSHVDRSIDDPLSFVYDNVVGTCHLLNYARTLMPNLEKIVYFSTDEVFGPADNGEWFKEWDRYNSGNPYSATKAGGEELAVSYHNTYGLPLMITHCMNVFGERQCSEKFIPSTIRKLLDGERIQIHCDRKVETVGSRVYMHAKEVCDALMYIVEHGEIGEKYNIVHNGPEREVDNLEMARMIAHIMNKELDYEKVLDRGSGQGYDIRYGLDGSKLKDMGWTCSNDLGDLLRKVIRWTRENKQWIEG